MRCFLCTPLLAAAISVLACPAAQAVQVQLGRPISLGGDAPPLIDTEPKPVGAADSAQSVDEREEEIPIKKEEGVVNSNELRSLGQPSSLLGSPSSATASDGNESDEVASSSEASGILGVMGGDMLQVVSALAVVLGLILTLRTVLVRTGKRLGSAGRPSGVVEVLARYPIARGQHLILLKMARRVLLLHQNGQSMTTLSEVSDPEEVGALLGRIEAGSSSPQEASRFRSMLSQFKREHDRAASSGAGGEISDAWNDGEVVDLTRRPRRSGASMFGRGEGRRV